VKVLELMKRDKIIAVLRARSQKEAIQKAIAIFKGGIRLIEITFTVPGADEIIRELVSELEDAVIGAGTVLNAEMCEKALKSGARFVVSPHVDEEISIVCGERVLYIPGIMTPTEVVKALKMSRTILKLFPGSALGPLYVKALKGPFPSVDIMPTGGVDLDNVCDWLNAGCFAVGVGSSLTRGTVHEVEEKARKFMMKIHECCTSCRL